MGYGEFRVLYINCLCCIDIRTDLVDADWFQSKTIRTLKDCALTINYFKHSFISILYYLYYFFLSMQNDWWSSDSPIAKVLSLGESSFLFPCWKNCVLHFVSWWYEINSIFYHHRKAMFMFVACSMVSN